MSTRQFVLISAMAAMLLPAWVACGGSSDDDDPTAAATPATQATAIVDATPARQTPTTPGPDAGPIVEWLTLNHAGAGAVTLVFRTNVPTTAAATGIAAGSPENVNPMLPARDDKLVTDHTLSLGSGGIDMVWEVTVTDAKGRVARATIESGDIVQKQYWARFGEGAPKVTIGTNRGATATWWNLYGQGDLHPGHVIVMSRRAGCTTAEACVGARVGSFGGDEPKVTTDKLAEQHAVRFEFPDNTHDYQVLLVGVPGAGGDRAFYQVDVPASAVK